MSQQENFYSTCPDCGIKVALLAPTRGPAPVQVCLDCRRADISARKAAKYVLESLRAEGVIPPKPNSEGS